MKINTCDDMVIALAEAPLDPRTNNKVVYNASWTADRDSMMGKRNEDWVRRELDWFCSGSNKLADMEAPVPQAFQACAGEDGTVNSAYGHVMFYGEDNLIGRAIDCFENEGLATRHATVIVSDRDIHNMAYENGKKDFICTNALNFNIDSTNTLHLNAQMRSMDAVWGYRADYSMWDLLLEEVANWLNTQADVEVPIHRGDITFQVANLHVYPRHHKLLDDTYMAITEQQDRQLWAINKEDKAA